ncbi:hypothetical protein P7K49_027149, partial [Saguinus oedipus]
HERGQQRGQQQQPRAPERSEALRGVFTGPRLGWGAWWRGGRCGCITPGPTARLLHPPRRSSFRRVGRRPHLAGLAGGPGARRTGVRALGMVVSGSPFSA